MKTPHLIQEGRSRPFSDGLDLVFIHINALGRDYIPQKDHLGCEEVRLLKVPIQLLLR